MAGHSRASLVPEASVRHKFEDVSHPLSLSASSSGLRGQRAPSYASTSGHNIYEQGEPLGRRQSAVCLKRFAASSQSLQMATSECQQLCLIFIRLNSPYLFRCHSRDKPIKMKIRRRITSNLKMRRNSERERQQGK